MHASMLVILQDLHVSRATACMCGCAGIQLSWRSAYILYANIGQFFIASCRYCGVLPQIHCIEICDLALRSLVGTVDKSNMYMAYHNTCIDWQTYISTCAFLQKPHAEQYYLHCGTIHVYIASMQSVCFVQADGSSGHRFFKLHLLAELDMMHT